MGREASLLLHALAILVGCSHLTGRGRYALASDDPESKVPEPTANKTEQFNASLITTARTPSSEAPTKYEDSTAGNHPTVPKGTASTSAHPFPEMNGSVSATPPKNTPRPSTPSSSTIPEPAATDISVSAKFNGTSPRTNESTVGGLTQTPGNQVDFNSTASSSTSSTQQPDHILSTTGKPHAAAHPYTVPESSATHSLQASSLSTQAKASENSPSQLNMGDRDQDQHRSGPLLAGLVSVFALAAAAVISLLLFLKFRQRGNRPEFRRLQDLPMDDMMEDTPLSMYNY